MKHTEQFMCEVQVRSEANFDKAFVLGITRSHDGSVDEVFREDATIKGFSGYLHCIVMERGSCSLDVHLSNQGLAGNNWDEIKRIMKQITRALEHLHLRGVVHGDLKRKHY